MLSSGGGASWSAQEDYLHLHLDLSANEDFNRLQNTLTNALTELLSRVERLESENRDLRANLDELWFRHRNGQ